MGCRRREAGEKERGHLHGGGFGPRCWAIALGLGTDRDVGCFAQDVGATALAVPAGRQLDCYGRCPCPAKHRSVSVSIRPGTDRDRHGFPGVARAAVPIGFPWQWWHAYPARSPYWDIVPAPRWTEKFLVFAATRFTFVSHLQLLG